MRSDKYAKSYASLVKDVAIKNTSLLIISVIALALVYRQLNLDQIVVIKPETLGSEAWITKSNASQSYKEAWGFFFAQLTGNVTPTDVDFVKERLKPLLAPKIYGEVIDSLVKQANDIKVDRVTMRFEPRTVEFEEATNKVFVYGTSYTKGASGKEEKTDRTYEYVIDINNYAPLLKDINTYSGQPRTEEEITKLDRVRERNEAKQ